MSQSNGSAVRAVLYAALAVLFVLHNDWWTWDDSRFVFGLPFGLAYHIAYCIAASALMALLVKFAWPRMLDDEQDETSAATEATDR